MKSVKSSAPKCRFGRGWLAIHGLYIELAVVLPFSQSLGVSSSIPFSSYEKWGEPVWGTSGGTVTWSIVPGTAVASPGYPYVPLDSFAPAAYAAHLQWAFDQWSAVADIHFIQVSDNGAAFATTPGAGIIRFTGIELAADSDVLAQTSGPIGYFYEAQSPFVATVRFTSTVAWSYSDAGPGYNFDRVALHEVGHLLGLQHEQSAPSVMNLWYSTRLPIGLQADDIAGAQFIYGPATSLPEPSSSHVVLLVSAVAACLRTKQVVAFVKARKKCHVRSQYKYGTATIRRTVRRTPAGTLCCW